MTQRQVCILIIALLGGCSDAEPPAEPPVVRDSAGVRIVEIARLEGLDLPRWTVAREPIAVIGLSDAQPGHDLFGVRGAGLLAGGRIVVADGTTAELRFFSPTGELLARAGRKGQGPGEFVGLLWLQVLPGDTILAYDFNLRRVTVFSGDGTLARSYAITPPTDAGYPEPKGAVASGSIVFVPGFDRRFGTGERRDTVPFFLYDREGALTAKLGAFPGREEFFGRSGEAAVRSEVPFGRDVLAAAGADRIVIGSNDSYELSAFDATGALSALLRANTSPRAVEPGELTEWKRLRLERMSEAARPRFTPFYEELPLRTTHPAFAALVVDREGMLWVERGPSEDGARGVWEVFSPSLEPVARAELPAGILLLDIDRARILARSLDVDGQELVSVYDLLRN